MVPNGWERKPIKELCDSIIDCVNKTAKHVDYVTPYKMIRTTNVRHGKVDTENVRYVDEDVYEKWIRRGAPKDGDIIFTREAPVGEAGILEDSNGIFLGQRTMMYRVNPKVANNRFVFYSLMSGYCQKQIEDLSNGGTVAHMRVPDCGEIIINSPPIEEQHKIAKILVTWDKAISTTEHIIGNSKQQKKALMQQLLTGKKRLFDDAGKAFEGEWEEIKLGDLKLDISDGNYSAKYPKQSDFIDSGIPFLRANNLRKGTISDTDMRFISPKQHSEITKGHLKKGDILLSTRGELGNVALVPNRHIGSNINAQLVRINTRNKLSGNFLFQLFDYLRVTGKFESLSTGTALKQLPIGKLKKLEFKLPLLIAEQQKIATVLTNADQEIELLEQQLADLQQEKKALMQQLLTGKKRVVVDGDNCER